MNLQVASLNFNEDADPMDTRGRPKTRAWKTEAVRERGGMLRKTNSPVLETRYGDGGGYQLARIR
ncbi:MAG: hypothetical protein QMD03_06315 [Syntrophales bacterium]|nr:hypothetical protein [Syntrophales bacterium]